MSSATLTMDAAEPSRPAINPWIIALAVTLATFMEVLDTSIANVALPHIAGGLSAGQDESTWVLTSYLVSNAVVLPMSAWLSERFGRKRFYMTCVALFTLSSFFCGLAPSLGLLVFFRILQGVGHTESHRFYGLGAGRDGTRRASGGPGQRAARGLVRLILYCLVHRNFGMRLVFICVLGVEPSPSHREFALI